MSIESMREKYLSCKTISSWVFIKNMSDGSIIDGQEREIRIKDKLIGMELYIK